MWLAFLIFIKHRTSSGLIEYISKYLNIFYLGCGWYSICICLWMFYKYNTVGKYVPCGKIDFE